MVILRTRTKQLFKPRLQDVTRSDFAVRALTLELLDFMDAATERHHDESTNRKMYSNQNNSEFAAMGMAMMGWLR